MYHKKNLNRGHNVGFDGVGELDPRGDIGSILRSLEGRDIPLSTDMSVRRDTDELEGENARLTEEVEKLRVLVSDYRRDYSLLQKRLLNEKEEYGELLLGDIIKSLMPMLDGFRGLEIYGEKVGDRGMVDGVLNIRKLYVDVLGRYGVKEIHLEDCKKKRAGRIAFDANYMEVVVVRNNDEMTSFPYELSSGWMVGDRVVIPIKVEMR